MRHKYFTGFQLASLHSLPYTLLICLAMGVLEIGLFSWQLLLGAGTFDFIGIWDTIWGHTIFRIAFVGVVFIIMRDSLGKSNSGYLVRRLAISDGQMGLVWSANSFLCFLIVWGWQIVLVALCHILFCMGTPADYWSHQSLFIDCYRNQFLHTIIPMGDITMWVRNLVVMGSMALATGHGMMKHWRQESSKLWLGCTMLWGWCYVANTSGMDIAGGIVFAVIGLFCCVDMWALEEKV